MSIWTLLRSIKESLLHSSTAPPQPSAPKTKTAKYAQVTPPKQATPQAPVSSHAATPTAAVKNDSSPAPQSKAIPKLAPLPPQPIATETFPPGVYTPFVGVEIDSKGIQCRCTPEIPDIDDDAIFIDIGIDFGTRYTKICFQNRDEKEPRVVTFDYGSPCLDQALILSQIAILERGEILTGLTSKEWENSQWPIKTKINFIKMYLAALDIPQSETDWPPNIKECDEPEKVENLAAYFLSRLIVRSRNWVKSTYPDLFKNRSATWSLQVGAPVEYWQGPAIDRFEYVLKLAWALSFTSLGREADLITLSQLNDCMVTIRDWVRQNPDLDCSAKPEIAGAVWSHIRATGSKEGFFILFDVGEGTIEGAAFRFFREDGEKKISFYSGFVKPLGVAALTHQLSQELGREYNVMRKQLLAFSSQDKTDQFPSIKVSQTRKRLQQLVGQVVMRGCGLYKKIHPYGWKEEVGPKLGIFVGGGGGQISFYRDAIMSTYVDFNHNRAGIKPYDLRSIPVPAKLTMSKLERNVFNRFAIAYGLSIPYGEFPEFDFPDASDIPPSRWEPVKPDNHEDGKDW
jgi:hypothetical protein